MNKIIIIILLILWPRFLPAQAQDTICFKVSTVQNILIDAKQKKHLDSLVIIYRSTIQAMEVQISEYRNIRANDADIMEVMQAQLSVMRSELAKAERRMRWQQWKTRIVGFAGAVAVGLILVL